VHWLVRRSLFAALAGLGLLAAGGGLAAAPAVSPPTRPGTTTSAVAASRESLWSTVSIGKIDYVDASAFATRLGLNFSWLEEGKRFQLKSAVGRLDFTVDSRESTINAQRVFLGDAVRQYKGRPHFSRIDVERLLTPIAQPGWSGTRVPALHTIVIDPGHGGEDIGTFNDHVKVVEKQATLDTALRLKQLLEADGYRVALTRTDDRKLELLERPLFALQEKADLFLSIHYNAVEKEAQQQSVSGVEVYVMTPQYQLSADLERDNQVDVFNPGNAYDHWNAVLGYAMHRELLRDLKVPDRGLKRGRRAVLRLAPCPAVLVESGYLTQDAEARKIATPAYRQKIAEAIADGVRAYAAILDGLRKKPAADLPH
jgi:N-acetylmuramoyl-L-alanine amidase